MDRIEQFIRDGLQRPRSPWVAIKRQALVAALFYGVVVSILAAVSPSETTLFRNLLPALPINAFIVYGAMFAFLFLPYLARIVWSKQARLHRQAWNRWKDADAARIASAPYEAAAEALRKFKPMSPIAAVEKYGQEVIDLLLVSGGIWFSQYQLRRLVSIRAIEEDREAGRDDE